MEVGLWERKVSPSVLPSAPLEREKERAVDVPFLCSTQRQTFHLNAFLPGPLVMEYHSY
jgi:hypothetical protein